MNGHDATHTRFNFREEIQMHDNRSHSNDGEKLFVASDAYWHSRVNWRAYDDSLPPPVFSIVDVRAADESRMGSSARQPVEASLAKLREISTQSGAANACAHTATGLDLADGLSLLG
jgi:hypothetical protein